MIMLVSLEEELSEFSGLLGHRFDHLEHIVVLLLLFLLESFRGGLGVDREPILIFCSFGWCRRSPRGWCCWRRLRRELEEPCSPVVELLLVLIFDELLANRGVADGRLRGQEEPRGCSRCSP
jgi:hypothetical protein